MAIGYPLSSDQGAVTSWGAAGFYNVFHAALAPVSSTIEISTDEIDTTALNGGTANSATTLPGLAQCSGTISARWPSTVRLGNVGLATFNSVNIFHAHAFSFTIAPAGVVDVTRLDATPPTWRSFMPVGPLVVTGQVQARVDSNTAVTPPTYATASSTATTLPDLVLLYGLGGTTNKISGSAMLSRTGVNISMGQAQTVGYNFRYTGAVTTSGTNSLFGGAVLDTPLWDQMGSTTNTLLTITSTSGITYAVSAFYRSITVNCEVGGPVTVSAQWQGTGACTF